MLLNVYKNKNNIPPLQGNYLISALPCHCKPLLSASAPSQPLIPRVFQLFPHFQDVSAPKSAPDPKRCHPRLGDTVGWGAESSSHLSAPSAPAPLTSQLPQPLTAPPAPLPGSPIPSHLAAALPSSPSQRRPRLSSCPTILSRSAGSAACAILPPSAWIISTVALRSSRRRWSSFGEAKVTGLGQQNQIQPSEGSDL